MSSASADAGAVGGSRENRASAGRIAAAERLGARASTWNRGSYRFFFDNTFMRSALRDDFARLASYHRLDGIELIDDGQEHHGL
jgi:hypothetical protein